MAQVQIGIYKFKESIKVEAVQNDDSTWNVTLLYTPNTVDSRSDKYLCYHYICSHEDFVKTFEPVDFNAKQKMLEISAKEAEKMYSE